MHAFVSDLTQRMNQLGIIASELWIASNLFDVRLHVPVSIDWDESEIGIRISSNQFSDAHRGACSNKYLRATLTLSQSIHTRLAAASDPLTITIPFNGLQHPVGLGIVVVGPNGMPVALPFRLRSDRKSLTGSLSPAVLKRLTDGSPADAPIELVVFSANG